MSQENIKARIADLKQQHLMLSFSDAVGTGAKMRVIQDEIYRLERTL